MALVLTFIFSTYVGIQHQPRNLQPRNQNHLPHRATSPRQRDRLHRRVQKPKAARMDVRVITDFNAPLTTVLISSALTHRVRARLRRRQNQHQPQNCLPQARAQERTTGRSTVRATIRISVSVNGVSISSAKSTQSARMQLPVHLVAHVSQVPNVRVLIVKRASASKDWLDTVCRSLVMLHSNDIACYRYSGIYTLRC